MLSRYICVCCVSNTHRFAEYSKAAENIKFADGLGAMAGNCREHKKRSMGVGLSASAETDKGGLS